ncbi:MAG TPA: VCBS repeat-containing protein [bacterium]|nr:VCBS repeat-containing protein [bacterium]
MKLDRYKVVVFAILISLLLMNANLVFSSNTDTFKLFYKGSGPDDPINLSNTRLAVGDINNDGKNELISTRWDFVSGLTSLQICQWNSRKKLFENILVIKNLKSIYAVTIGDVNNDNISEIIAIGSPDRVTIINWNGERYITNFYPLAGYPAEVIAVGDIDNDGKNEIIFGEVKDREEEWSLEDIVVWLWNGKDFDVISKSLDHVWIANLLVVDIDGDNKNELIVDEFEGKGRDSFRALNIYRYNKTTGSLEKDIEAKLKTDYGWAPITHLVLWKERGKKRLIAGYSILRKCSFENSKLTFISEPFKIPTNPRDLIVGDVDNDGKDEIIISGFGTKEETALFIYKKPVNIFLIISIIAGAILIIVLAVFFLIRTRRKKKTTTA